MNTRRPASGLSSRSRRRAALIATLAMPVSLLTAPAIAQGPTPFPTTPQAAPTSPTSAALARAKKDNKRVEIEALRSQTGTFFANPDGKTVHAELSSVPIRVNKDRTWQPIDTRLIEKDGVLQPKASLGELTLSAGGGTDALVYTNARGKVSLAAPAELPKPVVKDNTATYPDTYGPGADLVVTITPEGFRHDVVIRQRPVKDLKVRVPMRLPKGLKLGTGADRTPGLLDAKGKEVDDLGAAPVLDAAAMASPDHGHVGKASTAVDGDSLVLTAKADFLTNPAVTYPVTVTAASETWEGTGIAGDTHVSNVRPDGAVNATLQWLLAGKSHSGQQTHRTFIRFNIHDTPLAGGTVINADLRLHNWNSHTCSDTDSPGIVAHRITTPWTVNTLTWGNQPSVTINGQIGNRGAYSAQIPCPEGEGELYYSIEQMVQEWMNGQPDEGVRLTSPTEIVEQNWRYYRSDEYGGYDTYPFTPRGPVLFIEYEPAPVEPQGAVAWTSVDDPGIEDRADIERINADPESVNAVETQPSVPSITDEQAIQAREESEHEDIEVPMEDAVADDPGTDEPPPAEEPDTTPPVVLFTTPSQGTTDVPTNSQVKVVFSEGVHDVELSVTTTAGHAIAGTVTMQEASSVLIFTPAETLAANTSYSAEVGGAVDSAGNVMEASRTWSFTTGADTPQPIPGLVAAYGMNEGSGASVADSSGQSNTGAATDTTWAAGKHGTALSFNGSSSWVTVQDAASLRLTTGMTLSAWVNPASVSTWKPIVGKELEVDGVSYALYAANGNSSPSGWVHTDPDAFSTVNGTSTLPVNAWSHVALTYDGTALRLFVNGQQQVNQTPLSGSLYDEGHPLRIGGNDVWDEFFGGLIDEVRIYNRAQTAAEIQTDMNTPIGGTAPADTQAPTAPASLAATGGAGNVQLTWTASTDNVGVDGYRIHRSTTQGFTPSAANQVGSSPTTTFTDAGLAAGTYFYRVRAVDAAGNLGPSSNEVSATVTAPPTNPGLVAAYGMEEGTGTTVGDSSGQNNTGAATDTTWATGKHGTALSFNGSSSWVTVQDAASLRLTTGMTLSAWVAPASVSTWNPIVGKELEFDGVSYTLYAGSSSTGPYGWVQTDPVEISTVSRTSKLPVNAWSHVALTYDGAALRLFVNGQQQGTPTELSGSLYDEGHPLRIGGNDVWDEFFSGLIDEVRIYNRAQTAAEIQTDMDTPVGAAAPDVTARQLSTSSAPEIQKLVVGDSRTADGVTITSDLTPRLTAFLAAGRDGEATVEVEIAGKPTKTDGKTGKVIRDEQLIWSSHATAKPGDSRVTLQVPKGKLQAGDDVRWRARVTSDSGATPWSNWNNFELPLLPAKTAASAPYPPAENLPAPASSVFERLTPEKCAARKELAGRGIGWIANHFTWCQMGRVTAAVDYGGPFERYTAEVMLIGYTFNGKSDRKRPGETSRDLVVEAYVYNHNVYGSMPPTKTMVLNLSIGNQPHCEDVTSWNGQTVSNRKSALISSWVANGRATFRFKCDPNKASSKRKIHWNEANSSGNTWEEVSNLEERVSYGTFRAWANFPDWPNTRYRYVMANKDVQGFKGNIIRCDTASGTRYSSGGCIFYTVKPAMQWKFTAPVRNRTMYMTQAYLHYWNACVDADGETYPINQNKSIKGCDVPGSNRPADRQYMQRVSKEEADDNHDKTGPQCVALWGPDYTDGGKQCDEFPFASTRERTTGPSTGNWSLCPIDGGHNGDAGTALHEFYQKDRVIRGDQFTNRFKQSNVVPLSREELCGEP